MSPSIALNTPGSPRSPLARRLREARVAKGISQKRLGILIGIDPSSASPRINQYEQGKHLPDFRLAARLAETLGISAAFLYAEDDRLAHMILAFTSLSAEKQAQALKTLLPRDIRRKQPMSLPLEKRFGLLLKKHRTKCGLSQEALAFNADLHRTYISLLERGLRQPSLGTVFNLAKEIGVEPWQLVEKTQIEH